MAEMRILEEAKVMRPCRKCAWNYDRTGDVMHDEA